MKCSHPFHQRPVAYDILQPLPRSTRLSLSFPRKDLVPEPIRQPRPFPMMSPCLPEKQSLVTYDYTSPRPSILFQLSSPFISKEYTPGSPLPDLVSTRLSPSLVCTYCVQTDRIVTCSHKQEVHLHIKSYEHLPIHPAMRPPLMLPSQV